MVGTLFTLVEQRQRIDIETQESNDPCSFQLSKFITRQLRHSHQVHREEDGAVHFHQVIDECKKKQSDNTGYWSDEMKKHFVNAHHWSIEKRISVLAKGGGQKKRFQYCLNPNYLHQFLYFRAFEGHSGSTINPALQSNVLLPEGFTEFIYHVGNGKNWGRWWTMVWFQEESVSKQADKLCSSLLWIRWIIKMAWGETLCDSSQARIVPYKNTWRPFQNTVFWCNLKLAQQGRLQFYQTRFNAVILYDTLSAEFIEKAICMKTKDQLYHRESVIQRPRVVLEANSKSGSQDLPAQEARSSWESQQDAESYVGSRSNTADYRIPEKSISTVKLQDVRRQNDVTKMIEMFEKHQHKAQFLKDMSERQEINRFSEESQKLLVDMNHTEIFEFCENSAKLQCLDCNAFSDIGIICCSCGRNLKYSRSPTTFQKTTCDFTSILGFVMKKNSSRGPKQAASERQIMFFKAKEMFKRARHEKHGRHPTILARWYAQERYQDSLAKPNIGEKEVMLFDRIALERHDLSAAKAERLRNAKHWILRLNADGPQKASSTETRICRCIQQCLKLQDAHLAETQQSLRPREHQQRQREDQQFEGGENFDCYVDRKTGWRYHREPRGNASAASSSSTSQWQNSQWQTSWSSWYSTSSEKWWWFRFLGRNSRKIDGECGQDTHSQDTSVQYSLFTSAHRTLNADGLAQVQDQAWFASIFVPQCCYLVCHMSHSLLFSHLRVTTCTSSSSFTLPSTTQEHSPQPEQQEQLREHPIHHAHLQALSVDKLRHQESLWREDLQGGGNPRTTTPTSYEPQKSLRLSRESKLILEIHFNLWCTGKIPRRKSPCSYHRRSGGIWRDWDSWFTRFYNIREVLLPIADAFRRFRGKHCRFWSRRWRVTKDADFTSVCSESFGGNPMQWSCRRER